LPFHPLPTQILSVHLHQRRWLSPLKTSRRPTGPRHRSRTKSISKGTGGGLPRRRQRPHPRPQPHDFTSFAASTSMTFLAAEPLRSKAALLNAVKETPAELARPSREKPFSGSPPHSAPWSAPATPPAHHPNSQHPNEPRNDYRCGLECRAPSGQPCWTPPPSPRLAGRTLPPAASVELHPQTACLPAQAAVTYQGP
jgi:hypothetical protein